MGRRSGHGDDNGDGLHLAIFPWGGVVEDFLDPIGVSRRSFAAEMSGGWLFGLIEALRGQGIRSSIFCFSAEIATPDRIVNPDTGVASVFLPASRLYRFLRRWPGDADDPARPKLRRRVAVLQDVVRYLATPRSVAAAMKAQGCNAILAQEYENPRFDRLTAVGRRLGVPVFASFQGAPAAGNAFERAVRRRSVRHAAGFIVAAAPEAERLAQAYKLPDERIARIPNPLDLAVWRPEPRAASRRALGLPDKAVVFICHGRIDIHRKGLDLLLAAWSRLSALREGLDLRLHLIGSGQDDARLGAMLESTAVPGLRWVRRYVNDREEMRRELSAADVYVMASRHEGFPVAPLEAMACGLPVVATDAPGIGDIFANGEADGGIVVSRGASAPLCQAMERLAGDEELRASLSMRARRRVAEYCSLEAVGRNLADFIYKSAGM